MRSSPKETRRGHKASPSEESMRLPARSKFTEKEVIVKISFIAKLTVITKHH